MEALEALVVKAEIVSETKNKNDNFIEIDFSSVALSGIIVKNKYIRGVDVGKIFAIGYASMPLEIDTIPVYKNGKPNEEGWCTANFMLVVEAGKNPPKPIGIIKYFRNEHDVKREGREIITCNDCVGTHFLPSSVISDYEKAEGLRLYQNFIDYCRAILPILDPSDQTRRASKSLMR